MEKIMDLLTLILTTSTAGFAVFTLGFVCIKLISTIQKITELNKAETLIEVVETEERRGIAKQPLIEQEVIIPTVRTMDGRDIPMSELESY